VFNWRDETDTRRPYFRAVYLMQLIAVGVMVTGLFLVWWSGANSQTLFDLLNHSLSKLRARKPSVIADPFALLWLLWPLMIVAGLRGFTGILVSPVSYRRLALLLWVPAMMALAHFYVNFGDDLPDNSPLKIGAIGLGFWLTGSSAVILGLLMLLEGAIKPPDRSYLPRGVPHGAVDDAERLRKGDYQTCPHCGMLNEPDARTCYHCRNLLFSFDRED
jgi:hypothetical protein